MIWARIKVLVLIEKEVFLVVDSIKVFYKVIGALCSCSSEWKFVICWVDWKTWFIPFIFFVLVHNTTDLFWQANKISWKVSIQPENLRIHGNIQIGSQSYFVNHSRQSYYVLWKICGERNYWGPMQCCWLCAVSAKVQTSYPCLMLQDGKLLSV